MLKVLLGEPLWLVEMLNANVLVPPTPIWGLAGELRVVVTLTWGF